VCYALTMRRFRNSQPVPVRASLLGDGVVVEGGSVPESQIRDIVFLPFKIQHEPFRELLAFTGSLPGL